MARMESKNRKQEKNLKDKMKEIQIYTGEQSKGLAFSF